MRIKIDGVGERFKGDYSLASTSHVFRGTTGYETHFTISGRSPRTLIDLIDPVPAARVRARRSSSAS